MPSYNKGAYVIDGIRSVFAQTRGDWELWILENSTDGTTRQGIADAGFLKDSRINYEELDSVPRGRVNMMGWLLNRYYRDANGRYILYLSDDDLLQPRCLEFMAGYLDEHPEHGACWATLNCISANAPGITEGPNTHLYIPADGIRGPGTVDEKVDGGQVMHRASCLDDVSFPFFEETPDLLIARHIDGLFLEKLVKTHPLHPVGDFRTLIIHRVTPLSTYTKM